MKHLRHLWITAVVILAAFCFLDLSAAAPYPEEDPDCPGHFITTTCISTSDDHIAYNDPISGKQVIRNVVFVRLWGMQSGSGVAVATAPPPPATPASAAWNALAAAMLASIALAPGMIQQEDLKGRGRRAPGRQTDFLNV